MEQGEESYRRFLAGDNSALTTLVGCYYDGLVMFLLRMVGQKDIAEDLAEDTFLRLCLKKPKYKSEASFKTWLYTIARNLAIDHQRKSSRTAAVSYEELPETGISPEDVAQAYLRKENRLAVWRAMRAIKPEYAEILHLTYFEELSNREAAKVLKKSVHAIENLNYRARQALKTELEKEGFEYENV